MSSNKNKIRVVIADDHQLFIEGIKALLKDSENIVLAGEAKSGERLLEILKVNEVDVVLMDVSMPGMNGIWATQQITLSHPEVKVLGLTMMDDPKSISDMLKAGAVGYLLKTTRKQELLEAIASVNSSQRYLNKEVSMALIEYMLKMDNQVQEAPRDRNPSITKREQEIIRLIGEELSNDEIALQLNNSPMTISTHRKNILRKLNLKNTAGLVRYAVQHGFIG